ncbi:hypothetical protein BU25DRAFT_93019 [Macroventuria anomochaeta]|uniref:Uncharacterized protein n=1 Tax=Macroventuria anomochaeta TaxID=301207 RepID=A0ACB6RXJ2_9PLEO|nr:uncharacterized protein BU25DRAFT_93019 [Macroventuria anomochaeta]KAF2626700.1 hypothetical protein BU25DRAFT_93019 [Macroventuria anomochaeta]
MSVDSKWSMNAVAGDDPLSFIHRLYARICPSDTVPLSFHNYLRARVHYRTPVDTEPQSLNLDAHSIFWKMPSDGALYDVFHPFLANNIISSSWRKDHKTCFCDLVLHHIQELMTPTDIEKDCPEDGYAFIEGLDRIFAEPITTVIDEDISALANNSSVGDVNAHIASET